MKKNTDISERILQVIDYLDISRNEFAKILGYDRSQTVYDITNGKAKPSFDFFERLCNSEISETIDLAWLITGKGTMTTVKKESNHKAWEPEEKDQYIIDLQRNQIKLLDEKVTQLKKELQSASGYRNVAEPDH